MNEDRKYFGMTTMQIGILAGLAGVLILIVCIGGWFVLQNAGSGFSVIPPTQTLVPTVTPVPVTGPTATPTNIVSTAVPYEQLIPQGWTQYKTALIEIWLPSNFKLADKKTIDNTADLAVPELLITEIPSKSSAYNMLVGISYEPLTTGDSLDAYLDVEISKLPSDVRVTDRRTVFINSVEARQIMIELSVDNIDINNMVYVFLDGSTIWYVEYVGEIAEFFTNLAVFEESIKTFRMVR
jgi:hypothetical protein